MKMFKSNIGIIFILLLTVILMFTTGCNKNDTADVYIEMAQDYINEGNYEAAIEVLEKGMSSTGSTKIETYLKEVIALQLQGSSASKDNLDDKNSNALDYSIYEGTWAQDGIGWEYGGLLMDVKMANDALSIHCVFTQSAPSSRIAEISMSIAVDEIKDSAVVYQYDNDGWGNSGELRITFKTDSIECSFSDIKQSNDEIPAWGFYDDTYTLIQNDNAHDALSYTIEDYYELYPEENPDSWQDPNLIEGTYIYNSSGLLSVSETNIYMQSEAVLYVSISYIGSVSWECNSNIITLNWGEWDASSTIPLYITGVQNGNAVIKIFDSNHPDEYVSININVSGLSNTDTSKASGILASRGMTEEQFKATCVYLGTVYEGWGRPYDRIEAAGKQYYAEHPEDDKVEQYTKYWEDYLINGRASVHYTTERASSFDESENLEEFLYYTVYGPKGGSILGKAAEEIIKQMKEYPRDYVGQSFLLKSFDIDYVSNYSYCDESFVVYETPVTVHDYRDDVNYPTIFNGYNYDMYAIFLGNYTTYGGDIGLEFALISVEKCD